MWADEHDNAPTGRSRWGREGSTVAPTGRALIEAVQGAWVSRGGTQVLSLNQEVSSVSVEVSAAQSTDM